MTRSIALSALLLIGCSAPQQARGGSDLVGNPSCVRTPLIRQTLVRDARTIDFEMKSGLIVRNSLPAACPGLGPTRAIGYREFWNRICPGDLFTVLPANGPVLGPTCGFGTFEPLGPRVGR